MPRLLLALLLTLSSLAVAYPSIPDQSQSPGQLCNRNDSDFSEYRYGEKIAYCERHVSSSLKTKIYDSYRIPKGERGQYTIDHVIPLSIGGNNARRNLWPEHKKVKALRPELEQEVYEALRDGEITQAQAVRKILDEKFAARLEFELEEEFALME